MQNKIKLLKEEKISYEKLLESFQGWNAYAKWADCFKLRKRISEIITTKNICKLICSV